MHIPIRNGDSTAPKLTTGAIAAVDDIVDVGLEKVNEWEVETRC